MAWRKGHFVGSAERGLQKERAIAVREGMFEKKEGEKNGSGTPSQEYQWTSDVV